MPCPKCNARLIWQDRSWTAKGEDPGHWMCMMCGEVVYPEMVGSQKITPSDCDGMEGETMACHLNPEKEDEVRALLKDHSVREIVKITGVAKNTILRVRNESSTEEERAELKTQAMRKAKKEGEKVMTEGMKVCTKCGQSKAIGEFNKNATRPDGHESACRVCMTLAQRDWKAKREKRAGKGQQKVKARFALRPFTKQIPPEAVTLDAQLLRAVKKSAILDFVKNDLPRMVEESF